MKLTVNSLAAAFTLTLALAFQPANAQSQGEMNEQSYQDYKVADGKLNLTYKQVMNKIDGVAQAKLKKSQVAWIAFRDAQADLEATFVARNGTLAPTIYNTCLSEMTEARTAELEKLMKVYSD